MADNIIAKKTEDFAVRNSETLEISDKVKGIRDE